MMKVYLDTCSLQRPLDNKTQVRIILEAEAVLGIISLCESGQLELISSEALMFETNRNPKIIRREFGLEVLAMARIFVPLDNEIENRAREFNKLGLKALDSLHLASAEAARADYLCTCDDKFLRKATKIEGLKSKVVTPIDLVEDVEYGE
jgi:predicted nucleic acid-binding protein